MSSEIDDILNDMENEISNPNNEISVSNNETKEIIKKEIDVTDFESLASELIKMTQDDRKKADKAFELFFPEIALGKDRSQASKEALMRAIELKINAGKNIIDILKLLKNSEKNDNNIGIFFSSKKVGIDLDNIEKEL